MDIHANTKIFGLHEGISYGQNERVDELNTRITDRHFPDSPLAPNFDPRPVPTKYSRFPIVNRRKFSNTYIRPMVNHVVELNFNPATRNGPPNGYLANVDVETILTNRTVALQHGADQGVYIPSSNSDMYKVSVVSRPSDQPFPNLFKNPPLTTYINPKLEKNGIGKNYFDNNTRVQLRNSARK
jgi:hypothetical protein